MTTPETTAPRFPELFRDDVLRIETQRLWLRWPDVADAEALQELASFEAACRSNNWPRHLSEGETEKLIARLRAENAAGDALTMALTLKGSPRNPIGLIGVATEGGSDALALGYLLGVAHQGYGLMTEAVRELVGTVFRYSPFTRIKGLGGRGNIASLRVLEKAGFQNRASGSRAASARKAAAACGTLELSRAEWRHGTRPSAAGPRTRASVALRNEMPCGQAA